LKTLGTDPHHIHELRRRPGLDVADILQIPAFLCRQKIFFEAGEPADRQSKKALSSP